MNKIAAEIVAPADNGRNYGGKKELIDAYSVVACTKNGPVEAVTCRVYMGRSSRSSVVYASVWAHNRDKSVYIGGTGSASGWGYNKESAAIGEAIANAGVQLSINIKGTGRHVEALEALARALGYSGRLLVVEH